MTKHKISNSCPCGNFEFELIYKDELKDNSQFKFCMFCGDKVEEYDAYDELADELDFDTMEFDNDQEDYE